MAEVVLFHHVLGLTPGVVAFADRLREAGHTVHTPDSFNGRIFVTLEEGLGFVRQLGFGEVAEREEHFSSIPDFRSRNLAQLGLGEYPFRSMPWTEIRSL